MLIPDKNELEGHYNRGLTQEEVGKLYGVSQKVIYSWFKKLGIKARVAKKRNQLGKNNGSWKGGQYDERGYKYVKDPDHPNANHIGYVGEHIKVASKTIGRPLRRGKGKEVVHHIDGSKRNNAPTNLCVCQVPKHKRLHDSLMKIGYEAYKKGLVVFDGNKYAWAD